MATDTSYQDWLKKDFGEVIDTLEGLSDLQKRFLRSRWLDQVAWMEGRADASQRRYSTLRLTTIIGGVIVPALVSLGAVFNWVTVIVSLIVAISAAIEEFFHYGERWRHYRRTVELLKIEGWQFFQLSGMYRHFVNHAKAYAAFATRVEEFIRQDVEVFITKVVREEKEEEKPSADTQ